MKEMVGGCCVCSDERGWPENPLVYCDGQNCTVAVHQACYGIVTVPTGPWFCRKCESQERSVKVRCELCPSRDGALKRTDNQGWAHVVCALYIPEVRFGNVTTMEPIILQLIPQERYAKTCYICHDIGKPNRANVGACMQCNKFNCKQQFHVTCAQSLGLLCEEAGNYLDNVKYCGYCQHHYSKLKKGGNVKTIPPYKPITHDSSGSDSSSSPEKEIDSTANATASSTSATSIKITTNTGASASTSTSSSVPASSTKQRKSSTATKQSSLSTSSTSGVASGTNANSSGSIASNLTGSTGPNAVGLAANNAPPTATGTNTSGSSTNSGSSSSKVNTSSSSASKEKEKHGKSVNKISSGKDKDKDKDLSSSSSSSSSTREKSSKSKNKDTTDHGNNVGGATAAGGGTGAGSGSTAASASSAMGLDLALTTPDGGEALSNTPSSTTSGKSSGGSTAKKRKAESKASILTDNVDINHPFRDIIKDVSVTLMPLPLDKSSDLGEIEKSSKKQKTELSPPTHQSTEATIPNASQAAAPVDASNSSSSSSSSSSISSHHKQARERDERLRSSPPYASTPGTGVGSGGVAGSTAPPTGSTTASGAPSLYVSVPLSTANVPGVSLPSTTTSDHPTPSQSTRAATQQLQTTSTIIERQSPRINHQPVASSPAVSEHGNFSSSLPSPAHGVILQSGKSPSPNVAAGLTATTTESGNLKISYEKQNSRVAQLQEQESAPVRRSRSRSGESSNSISSKPRFGKKRSAAASNTPLAKSSSSSSLPASGSIEQQQQQVTQQLRSTTATSGMDIYSDKSQQQPSTPPSPVPLLAAPQPLSAPATMPTKSNEIDKIGNFSNFASGNSNNNAGNGNGNSAINLSSSSALSSTPPLPPPSTTSTASFPPFSTSSSSTASLINLTSTSSSSPLTTVSSVKSNKNNAMSNESVTTTPAHIGSSRRNSCSPITPSPPSAALSSSSQPAFSSQMVTNVTAAAKPLNKKLLRAQQSHYMQQQQFAAQQLQQQQQQQNVASAKSFDSTTTTTTSSPLNEQISNNNPPPPSTISRTPDSGIFSSSFNISGSSQSSLSAGQTVPSATLPNGGLKFTYEAQPGVAAITPTPPTIDTNLANNNTASTFKDSPPSSPGSEAGSARKRGRKANDVKDVKVFQNGGCAITAPTQPATTNGPMHATHMLGNQLNPTSSVAQKLTDQLHMEIQDHSVYSEPQPPQFVGVPFPAKPINNVRNTSSVPSGANSLASMFGGGNGGGFAPQSLEQLLERQWEQGSQFLMEQAQHFDIASLLSCLHQLQTENVRLEEHVNNLIARRDHLLAVNARLAIPLNANVSQSQVNLNNIHLNGPTPPDVAITAAAQSAASVPTSSANAAGTSNATSGAGGRASRTGSSASSQLPTIENGIDFRHATHQQSTPAVPPPTASALTPSTGSGLRHSSSAHQNFSNTTSSSSASHHSNHQQHHQQHQPHQHHQQQQQQALTVPPQPHSTLSSSASASSSSSSSAPSSASIGSSSSISTGSSRQQQLSLPPSHHHQTQPSHTHQQSHHSQSHHSHHVQQQQQQQPQSLHSHHSHSQHPPHSLVQQQQQQQHSHHHHHPSSTGTAASHHMQHQISISSSGTVPSAAGRSGNSGNSGVGGASSMHTGRSGLSDNSAYHPVYSHQSQLRRDETSHGKPS